jgi:hypothetical protein
MQQAGRAATIQICVLEAYSSNLDPVTIYNERNTLTHRCPGEYKETAHGGLFPKPNLFIVHCINVSIDGK